MLRYYFDELRYQKATVFIYDFNSASIRLHQTLGFQLEGQLRRMAYTQGRLHDQFVYGLLAEEFRNLHRNGAKARSEPDDRCTTLCDC